MSMEDKASDDACAGNLGYEDLLKDLRSAGDLRWTLSFHGPSQTPSVSADYIKQQVIQSDRVRDVIAQLASAGAANAAGEPVEDSYSLTEKLRGKVRDILDEMGHQYNMKYIRLLGYILIKAVRRMYEHIWINAEALQEKQSLFAVPNVPVILMPTHRSYADFLLVSFVAFHYGLPLPVIASGIDFLGMTGVGQILRRAGAFFIRRSFTDDLLYRTVFSEYIQAVVSKQMQPMEFFVEGTRSRSGKSLYPKFGLLQTAVEVFLRGKVSDIVVIPVSITYERTLEEWLYARELLGIPKPRESTSGLLKARKVLADNYGSIWFHMGEPISVRDFLTGKVDRSCFGTIPRNMIVMDSQDAGVVRDLGLGIVKEQQANIRIHEWSILATVLLHRLRHGETSFPVPLLLHECNDLLYILRQTAPGHEHRTFFSQESLRHCQNIHGNVIRQSSESDVIEFQPNLLKAVDVLHMVLAHYRNHLLHRVVDLAVMYLVRKANWSAADPYLFLMQLFSREFVLDAKFSGSPSPGLTAFEFNGKSLAIYSVLESLVEPFIVAYSMILHVIQSNLFATRSVFRNAKELGTILKPALLKFLSDGVYGGYEILSTDLMANCIQALKVMDALLLREGQFVLNRRVIVELCFKLDTFVPVDVLLAIRENVEKSFGVLNAGAKI